MLEQFKKEIHEGLNSPNKSLPSKYFYDQMGDALFVEIMHLPEYYVTRAELDIFENQTSEIVKALKINTANYFELIELGAGDGLKTKKLLHYLSKNAFNFDYVPIDISQNALDNLEADLKKELPKVSVNKKQGDYFEILASLNENQNSKVILFLGSNLGNMSDEIATKFLSALAANLHFGDKLLLGADMIKSKDIIRPAYNDAKGVTAAFNYNLLVRINKELGADFNINQFKHEPEYDEDEGIAKSYLVSQIEQTIYIKALNKSYTFLKGEKIQTEISRKYNDQIIKKLITKTEFKIANKLVDSANLFSLYLLEKKSFE